MEGVVRRISLLVDRVGAGEEGTEEPEGEALRSKSSSAAEYLGSTLRKLAKLPAAPLTWRRGLRTGADEASEVGAEAVAFVLVFFCQEKEGAEELEGAEAFVAALVGAMPGCGAPCLAAVPKDEATDRAGSFSYMLPF